ncbi:MAG: RNA polymerase sigma factor [Acidimicrobiales bacterium]
MRPTAGQAEPQGSLDDLGLLRAAGRGDEGALGELYDRHAGWLTLRLSRRCGSSDLVDQAVQDTFLAAWSQARHFRGAGEVGAFIWGIGIRRLVDLVRRQARTPVERAWWVPSWAAREDLVASAEDEVLLGVEHGRLGVALDHLSPELREAMAATVIDGLSYTEAARLLGVPVGTLKSRCHRARIELREALI